MKRVFIGGLILAGAVAVAAVCWHQTPWFIGITDMMTVAADG